MFMFSTLTLTGKHIPGSVTLSRKESFPSRQHHFVDEEYHQRSDWGAAPLPKETGHLSLQLGERMSFGRSAVVYAAKIIRGDEEAQHGASPTTASPRDDELCVKIARPNRCRTLAREAWVYERLSDAKVQGVIAPRYYGFFATTVPSGRKRFPLWNSDDFILETVPPFGQNPDVEDPDRDDPTRDDPLPDDGPLPEETSPGCRELSPWVDWKPDRKAPLLSVLVLARGGPSYTDEDDTDKENQ